MIRCGRGGPYTKQTTRTRQQRGDNWTKSWIANYGDVPEVWIEIPEISVNNTSQSDKAMCCIMLDKLLDGIQRCFLFRAVHPFLTTGMAIARLRK